MPHDHVRDKLPAYRVYTSSVLEYLGQFAAPPPALAQQQSAALASLLIAPMHSVFFRGHVGAWRLQGADSASGR